MKLRKITIYKNLLFATLFSATLISGVNAANAALSLSYAVTGGSSSSIVYDPSVDGLLHGNNLTVTGVTGTDTPLNSGTNHTIAGGLLNFQTGAFTSQSQGVWNFGGGGTISLTGGISDMSLPSSSTILTGSFLSATVTELPVGSFRFDIVGATFGDSDNPAVYSYFGVPAGSTCSNAMSLSFLANSIPGGGFTSGNNTIAGQVVDSPTPIPAAAWLLGSGLMGLVGIRRRTEK
jgi:hypothetical protein